MKLTATNVPPELAEEFARLVSINTAPPNGQTTGRTRRAVKRPGRKKRASATLADAYALANELAAYFRISTTKTTGQHWIVARAAAIYTGKVEPEWWEYAIEHSTGTVYAEISSIENLNPSPYAYRDPDNRPTIPTYTALDETDEAPRYEGSTTGDLYSDTYLSWRYKHWSIPEANAKGKKPPVWIVVTGSLVVAASNRGSRPMFSLMLRATRGDFADTAELDYLPTDQAAKSYFWRYVVPDTPPPYFSATKPRRIVARVKGGPGPFYEPDVGIQISPRPMMGRGYNNNTAVTVTWNGTEKCLIPNACAQENRLPITHNNFGAFRWHDMATGENDTLPWAPGSSAAQLNNRLWLHYTYAGDWEIATYTGQPIKTLQRPAQALQWVGNCAAASPGWWVSARMAGYWTGTGPKICDLHYDSDGTLLEQRNIEFDNVGGQSQFIIGCLKSGHVLDNDRWCRMPGDARRWILQTPITMQHLTEFGGQPYAATADGAIWLFDNPPAVMSNPTDWREQRYWTTCRKIAETPANPTMLLKGQRGVYVCHAAGHTLVGATGIISSGAYKPSTGESFGATTCNQITS